MVDYLMVRKTDRCLVKAVKVSLQHGSVISPLLFAVVSSELLFGTTRSDVKSVKVPVVEVAKRTN